MTTRTSEGNLDLDVGESTQDVGETTGHQSNDGSDG